MTNRLDVEHGREIVARWHVLAEQRLEYLTELFESGRWRRYHGEAEFLENIREAKNAVEKWRDLSTREYSLDNSSVDISWLGCAPRRCDSHDDRTTERQSSSEQTEFESLLLDTLASLESELVPSEEAAFTPAVEEALQQSLDIATMEQRYPLLHNAL